MNKLIKWILAGLGVVVVLLVITAVVLPRSVDPNNYKEEIRENVLKETGRELTIGGDIQWTVFPWIGLGLSDVELGNRSGFGDRPMLKIGAASLSVKLMPLLNRKVEIGKVTLTDVSAYLRQNADGTNNWEDLSDSQSNTSSTGEGDFDSFVVSGIEISNANVTWDDAEQIIELKDFNLDATNIELGRPFDLEGGFSVNLQQSQFAADVTFGGLVQSEANGSGYGIEGLFISLNGTQGPAGESTSLDMAVNTNADIDLTADQATLSDFVLRIDKSTFTGNLKVDNFSHPRLAFNFQVDRLNLDDYLPATETEEEDLTVDMFRGFTGGGDFNIGELVVAGLTATDVRMTMSSDGKGIRLFPLSAQFYGGQYKGEIKIDASGSRPILTTSQELANVRTESLLQDLTGTARLAGAGAFHFKGRTDLTNSRSIRQDLSGDMGMKVLDGAIVGINVADTIRLAKSALGKQDETGATTGEDEKTEFSELTMTGLISQGILRSDDLMMNSPLLKMTGKGSVNLVDETIKYSIKPVLTGALEGMAGQGLDELSGVPIPIKLSGSLYEPDFSVDIVAALAGSQKARIDEKKDKLIGKLLGGKDDSDADGQQEEVGEKDDSAGSLLKGLFGSKKDKAKNKDPADDGSG